MTRGAAIIQSHLEICIAMQRTGAPLRALTNLCEQRVGMDTDSPILSWGRIARQLPKAKGPLPRLRLIQIMQTLNRNSRAGSESPRRQRADAEPKP